MATAALKMPDRVSAIALAAAAAWAVALLVAAFLVPIGGSVSASSSGVITYGTATFVDINGVHGAAVVGIPLLCTVLVAGALLLRRRRAAVPCAWAVTGVLALFNMLAMLTIGLFVVPVTAALVVACTATTARQPAVST